MAVTTNRKLTVQEYLTYADGSGTRHELVDGDLVPMSLGTGNHGKITKFLEKALDAEILRSGYVWPAERCNYSAWALSQICPHPLPLLRTTFGLLPREKGLWIEVPLLGERA